LGIVSIPPIYGDDWGMVDDCFTHIIDHIDNDLHPIILMIANDTI
jgi:DNA helicase TIP49 (TBP-interacting protein)